MGADHLQVAGCNHRNAPVALRERLSLSSEKAIRFLSHLKGRYEIGGAVALGTCNRVEIYVSSPPGRIPPDQILRELFAWKKATLQEGDFPFYAYQGEDAVRHLFQVAAGLDSMVLGETEIIGQVKAAYREAKRASLTDPALDLLFQKSLEVAKRVCHETGLGQGRVSVASVAVDFLERVFSPLASCRLLVVGAGQTAELLLERLYAAGVRKIMLCNRTEEKTQLVIGRFPAEYLPLEELRRRLSWCDALVLCTSAEGFLLESEDFQAALDERRQRPMVVMDLSVPRNVPGEAALLEDLFLYNVDDLQAVVNDTLTRRRGCLEEARWIVHQEVDSFLERTRHLAIAPLISEWKNQALSIGKEESQRMLARLDGLGENERQQVLEMANRIVNKMLHHPIAVLKRNVAAGNGASLCEAIRTLFALPPESGNSLENETENP